MTTILRIEHSVQDFDGWKKKAFDSDPLGREKSGVRRYQVLRPVDNPKYVMIDLEFDNSSKAEAFRTALRDLWSHGQVQKIIENPRVQIVEAVETKEYWLSRETCVELDVKNEAASMPTSFYFNSWCYCSVSAESSTSLKKI